MYSSLSSLTTFRVYLILLLLLSLGIHLIFAQTPIPSASNLPPPSSPSPSPSSPSPSPSSPSPSPALSSNSPSPSRTSASPPSPTATKDPCALGRCTPPGKSKECIVISKIWMYRDVNKQAYLPVDVSSYFRDRFKNFDASTFPKELNSAENYTDLFGNKDWSYWGKHYDLFNLMQAGCALPTQKFYLVWTLMDIYQYYQDKQDHCAMGPPLEICADTLDQRADRVIADINNKTLCNGPPEYITAGKNYADRLRSHPFRSNSPTCVDGLVVEADAGKCGWFTQYSACIFKDTCPSLTSEVADNCPNIIDMFNKAYNPAQVVAGSDDPSTKSNIVVPAVIGGVIALAMVGGLLALKMTRRKSGGVLATLGRSLSRRNPHPPPPPPDTTTVPSNVDSNHLDNPQLGDRDNNVNNNFSSSIPSSTNDIGALAAEPSIPLSTTPMSVLISGSPMISGLGPDGQPIMSSLVTTDLNGLSTTPDTAIVYVDTYGNPIMMPPTVYTSSANSPPNLSADGVMDITTTTNNYTQQHNDTYVTTTTSTEEYVMYVDEHGNPCDERGNPISSTSIPPPIISSNVNVPPLLTTTTTVSQGNNVPSSTS